MRQGACIGAGATQGLESLICYHMLLLSKAFLTPVILATLAPLKVERVPAGCVVLVNWRHAALDNGPVMLSLLHAIHWGGRREVLGLDCGVAVCDESSGRLCPV